MSTIYRAVYSTRIGWWSIEENGRAVGWFPSEAYARAFAQSMNWYRAALSFGMDMLIPAKRPKQPELN